MNSTEIISDHISDCSASDIEDDEKKEKEMPATTLTSTLLPWTGALVWPLMLALPLLLSSPDSPVSYQRVFPKEWYEYDPSGNEWAKPLGVVLGILAVGVGQFFTCTFFYLFKNGFLSTTRPTSIQTKGTQSYDFWEGLSTHLGQPEGFGLLVTYLSVTWMFNLLPKSYYSFEGGIHYDKVFLCLVIQDGIQFVMHLLEHIVSPAFYQKSHKPHHRFINPRMFDAFNGSLTDTLCMILLPLFATAHIMRNVNVWTYMSFGSSYACWLTLIHSEYTFCWDRLFRKIGFGTPADHHVHHKFFKFNYGHLFLWWDQLAGTYRDPDNFAPRLFHPNV